MTRPVHRDHLEASRTSCVPVVVLEADTPGGVAVRRLEHTQVSGLPSSTMDAWLAW